MAYTLSRLSEKLMDKNDWLDLFESIYGSLNNVSLLFEAENEAKMNSETPSFMKILSRGIMETMEVTFEDSKFIQELKRKAREHFLVFRVAPGFQEMTIQKSIPKKLEESLMAENRD